MGGQGDVLTKDEQRVLQAVYDAFRELNTWPTFGHIDRPLHRAHRIDVARVIQGIPSSLVLSLGPPGNNPSPDVPMRLTAKGVSRCEGSEDDLDLFLRALRWIAVREQRFEPATDAHTAAFTVTDRVLARALKLPKARTNDVRRLGGILDVEYWGQVHGGGTPGKTSWQFTVGRDVRRFRRVRTIEDYLAAREQWTEEATMRAPMVKAEPAEPPNKALAKTVTYVDPAIISAIEARQSSSKWKCGKLLRLIAELNENYVSDQAYGAHALLRAILDHIPPVFGYQDFAQVVANHRWSRTDKRYAKRLLDFKTQADDALHRQISSAGPELLIDLDDLPQRPTVNRVLHEFVGLL